jgi:predicted O-methyltransferase YrrM
LRDRARYFTHVRCFSLEHDPDWLEKTRRLLRRLDLTSFVEPIYAPLQLEKTDGGEVYTYDTSLAPAQGIDFVLIDGPPHDVGRANVVPQLRSRLSPDAVIVLDDAGRRSEQACCENWTRNDGLVLHGFLPLGHGLALLTNPSGLVRHRQSPRCQPSDAPRCHAD